MVAVRTEKNFQDLVEEMWRNDEESGKKIEREEGVAAEAETDVEIEIEAEIGTGDVGATAEIETDTVTDTGEAEAECNVDLMKKAVDISSLACFCCCIQSYNYQMSGQAC